MTIPNIILRAEISQYLAANALKKGGLFGGGTPAYLPSLLYQVRKNVSYMYDADPSNEYLIKVANYLYSLCGAYGVQATNLINAGGVVNVIIPGLSLPNAVNFIVDATTSPILEGGSTLSIPAFIGYNVLFFRNGFKQSPTNNGGQYYSWNSTTGLFTCYGAAVLDDDFSINAI